MSSGPESPEERGKRADQVPAEAEALVEVFNRFTFRGSRRVRQQDAVAVGHPEPEGSDAGLWPQHEAGEADPEAGVAIGPDQQAASPAWTDTGEDEAATYIRPYAWTGGRTKSNFRFELETLVETSEMCQTAQLERLEHHSIAHLCRQPRSVAEVGAMLRIPLGVTRVLLGDMAELGLITVHRTVSENGSAAHLMLMERVLSGLKRL